MALLCKLSLSMVCEEANNQPWLNRFLLHWYTAVAYTCFICLIKLYFVPFFSPNCAEFPRVAKQNKQNNTKINKREKKPSEQEPVQYVIKSAVFQPFMPFSHLGFNSKVRKENLQLPGSVSSLGNGDITLCQQTLLLCEEERVLKLHPPSTHTHHQAVPIQHTIQAQRKGRLAKTV